MHTMYSVCVCLMAIYNYYTSVEVCGPPLLLKCTLYTCLTISTLLCCVLLCIVCACRHLDINVVISI